MASTVWLLAFVKLSLHLATTGRYGYFADEFYYLDCADHLDWGFVEFPPASVLVLAVWKSLFGTSLLAIRFPPALLGAALVLMAGLLARELGGGRVAQTLAALATLICPVLLVFHNYYSPNPIDYLLWTLAAFVLVRILRGANRSTWAVLGLLLGIGLLNKGSVTWLGIGIGVGLVLTPHRRLLRTSGPWIAAGIALLLVAPHVAWQVQHGWPMLEFVGAMRAYKVGPVSARELLVGQIIAAHPVLFPVWLAGLWWLLGSQAGRRFAPLGIIYLVLLAILVAVGTSKASYPAPAYPMLFAAGSIAIERFALHIARPRLPLVIGALLVAAGLVSLPMALPVLPAEQFIHYQRWLGVEPPSVERRAPARLPGHFAGMHDWPEIVASVAAAYATLPPSEQQESTIFTDHYADVGAINLLGDAHGLPTAISAHNSYALWGPGNASGRILVAVGFPLDRLEPWYNSIVTAGHVSCHYCLPSRADRPIYIARDPKRPFADFLAAMRHFD